jgi:hypothetical protein
MSESLKEKAKTNAEVLHILSELPVEKFREDQKPEWIPFEDAQKELDNLRWNLQRTIISLQKELKELKEGKQSG